MPTMLRDAAISFPMLGDLTLDFPASFEVFGHTIYLYGIVMALTFIVAVLYAAKKSKVVGVKSDDIYDLVIWAVPLAVVGCRLYYVACEWDQFKDNLISILYIWEGGIAMLGGTFAGVLTAVVWARKKKYPIGAVLDIGLASLLLGQVVGRWANFVNREAFGYETEIFCRMGLTVPGQETIYVHPTFLYESLWNLIGVLIINLYFFRKDHRKYDGQVAFFYMFWYGMARLMVEGLRTDSLYIPGTNIRTSQLVGGILAVAGLVLLIVNARRPHKEPYARRVAAQAAEESAVKEDGAETSAPEEAPLPAQESGEEQKQEVN